MVSDLDRDMAGGRLTNLGSPRCPTDAVRLIDLEDMVGRATLPLYRGGERAATGGSASSHTLTEDGTIMFSFVVSFTEQSF